MNKKSFFKSLFFFLSILSISSFAQTQGEMNLEAEKEFQKADHELNQVYKEILENYKEDKLFIQRFKEAQKAWIVFRDSHIKSLFPEEENSYGSVYKMCYFNSLNEITRKRIEELKFWLVKIEEGDVCSGSRKTKF